MVIKMISLEEKAKNYIKNKGEAVTIYLMPVVSTGG